MRPQKVSAAELASRMDAAVHACVMLLLRSFLSPPSGIEREELLDFLWSCQRQFSELFGAVAESQGVGPTEWLAEQEARGMPVAWPRDS